MASVATGRGIEGNGVSGRFDISLFFSLVRGPGTGRRCLKGGGEVSVFVAK